MVVGIEEQTLVASGAHGKGKKPVKCWKCGVNSHATKDCTVHHYYLVCDKVAHPTARCPTLILLRPTMFVAGSGTDVTFFAIT
jgi:hypothetical protein